MRRPSRTALTMVAKLSSARTMSAACLETSVPAWPMATPMSARRRGGVIDAVAGHGHHLPAGLPGLDDVELLFGGGAGVHGDVGDVLGQIPTTLLGEVGAA